MPRSARPPSTMDAIRRRIWDAHAADPDRYSFVNMSQALGKNASYMQQFMHRRQFQELPERERIALERFLGMRAGELRSGELEALLQADYPSMVGGYDMSDEAELVPLEQVPQRFRVLLSRPSFELWRLLENRAGPEFAVGDFLLVDTHVERRRPRCYVLATVRENDHSKAILRLSLPPYLYTVGYATQGQGLELAETEDGETIRARGVVLDVHVALEP